MMYKTRHAMNIKEIFKIFTTLYCNIDLRNCFGNENLEEMKKKFFSGIHKEIFEADIKLMACDDDA